MLFLLGGGGGGGSGGAFGKLVHRRRLKKDFKTRTCSIKNTQHSLQHASVTCCYNRNACHHTVAKVYTFS